jgi:ABC-type transport system involved in multi-copper enzyme maturation permease subunit
VNALVTVSKIASFDFFESIRSRRALALLVLYVAGSIAGTAMFVKFIVAFENTAATVLSVGQTESAGAMTEELMQTENMYRFFKDLVGDDAIARSLMNIPPLAMFYGWLALTFIPLLVTFTSGDSVAAEVASGSVRFALFRVDRLSWAVGKLFGQTLLMLVGILAGALASLATSSMLMTNTHPGLTAIWLVRFSGRAAVYGFAYLGLVVGCSLVAKSLNGARAAALIGLFAIGVGGNLLEGEWTTTTFPVLAPTLSTIFPQGHDLDLWRVTLADRAPGIVMLLALGLAYFTAGYAMFARRDP